MKKGIVLTVAVLLVLLFSMAFTASSGWAASEGVMVADNTPQVELYVTSWCPYCKKAVEFFESRGIAVAVYDIEEDADAARRKARLDPRRGVPFAVINGQYIHGYSAAAYERALEGN